MNEELSHVNDWFALNKLSLNLKKTNYILFRSHRKPIPSNTLTLHINNVEIPRVSSKKFLGILVDQFLIWSNHISNIASKISRNLGILSRTTYLLPQHIRKNSYYTMIHPYPIATLSEPLTTLLSYLNYTPYKIVLFAWYLEPLPDFRQTKCIKRPIFLSWIKFVLLKQVNSCLKITVAYYQIPFLTISQLFLA